MKEEEKILLIHKIIIGEATSDERLKYINWLKEDESNMCFDEEIKAVWEKTKNIHKEDVIFDKDKLKSKIFRQISELADSSKNNSGSKVRIAFINRLTTVAAIFLLIIGIVFIFNNYSLLRGDKTNEKINYVKLTDNSSVWVDENSSVKVKNSFTGNKREIFLKGNGYFEITHNKSKPCIVYVDKSKIQVLGTSFQVISKKGKNVKVNVFSGVVKFFGNDNKSIMLHKDEGAEFDYKSNSFIKFSKEGFKEDFKYQYLAFENSYLTGVFKKLSEFYKVDIELSCYDIKNMTGFTSPVNYGNTLEDYFSSIMKLYPLSIKKIDDKRYIVSCRYK